MNADTRSPAVGMPELSSLVELLHLRANRQINEVAYVQSTKAELVDESISFFDIQHRSTLLASRLAECALPGERVLVVSPNGLEFIIGVFGCLIAGLIAVPVMAPRRTPGRDATLSIAQNCGARIALVPTDSRGMPKAEIVASLADLGILCLGVIDTLGLQIMSFPAIGRNDIAILQYTSGSTSAPKGVVVSHGNLLSNLEMMRKALGTDERSTHVCWLPLHHDMGLILNVLHTLYVGATCVLMSPTGFMHRPLSWLQAIHRHGAHVASAPNFALELCVDRLRPEEMANIDLGLWQVACIGAEPVRPATLKRFADAFAPYGFRPQALLPGYGLAEASVYVATPRRHDGATCVPASLAELATGMMKKPQAEKDVIMLAGCGWPVTPGEVAIVAPETSVRQANGTVGEIWVRGPHVARGYWQNPQETARVFGARIADEELGDWLRSGDLGTIGPSGELIVTGRIKDLIIIRGINHYPQDIEITAAMSHPALRRDGGAAFGVTDDVGDERLILVQEVARNHDGVTQAVLVGAIRAAVVAQHGVMVHCVALVRVGTLPKTTSGKVQRLLARQQWESGQLVPSATPVGETVP